MNDIDVSKLEAKPGDVVVFESKVRLTERAIEALNRTVKDSKWPTGVRAIVLEQGMSVRVMPKQAQRALLDELCSALGVRVVPL